MYCTVEAIDRHEASRGLSATAEVLVIRIEHRGVRFAVLALLVHVLCNNVLITSLRLFKVETEKHNFTLKFSYICQVRIW